MARYLLDVASLEHRYSPANVLRKFAAVECIIFRSERRDPDHSASVGICPPTIIMAFLSPMIMYGCLGVKLLLSRMGPVALILSPVFDRVFQSLFSRQVYPVDLYLKILRPSVFSAVIFLSHRPLTAGSSLNIDRDLKFQYD